MALECWSGPGLSQPLLYLRWSIEVTIAPRAFDFMAHPNDSQDDPEQDTRQHEPRPGVPPLGCTVLLFVPIVVHALHHGFLSQPSPRIKDPLLPSAPSLWQVYFNTHFICALQTSETQSSLQHFSPVLSPTLRRNSRRHRTPNLVRRTRPKRGHTQIQTPRPQ